MITVGCFHPKLSRGGEHTETRSNINIGSGLQQGVRSGLFSLSIAGWMECGGWSEVGGAGKAGVRCQLWMWVSVFRCCCCFCFVVDMIVVIIVAQKWAQIYQGRWRCLAQWLVQARSGWADPCQAEGAREDLAGECNNYCLVPTSVPPPHLNTHTHILSYCFKPCLHTTTDCRLWLLSWDPNQTFQHLIQQALWLCLFDLCSWLGDCGWSKRQQPQWGCPVIRPQALGGTSWCYVFWFYFALFFLYFVNVHNTHTTSWACLGSGLNCQVALTSGWALFWDQNRMGDLMIVEWKHLN